MKIFAFLGLTLLLQGMVYAQAADLTTIDGILDELLDIITRDPGEEFEEDRYLRLFLPKATFTVLYQEGDMDRPYETVSLDEFVVLLKDPYYTAGFREWELHKVVDEFNGIAQVFQTTRAQDSDGEDVRMVNSYQLLQMEGRWWIYSILWTNETQDEPIPQKYLPKQ